MSGRKRRLERGQDLIEYALVLPVFLLLVMAIVDLGRVVYYYSALQNAAREGGRYAIIHPCNTAIIKFVVKSRAPGLNITDADIDISTYSMTADTPPQKEVNGCTKDKTIHITVRNRFLPVTPLIGGLLNLSSPGDSLTIVTNTTMRIEQ